MRVALRRLGLAGHFFKRPRRDHVAERRRLVHNLVDQIEAAERYIDLQFARKNVDPQHKVFKDSLSKQLVRQARLAYRAGHLVDDELEAKELLCRDVDVVVPLA